MGAILKNIKISHKIMGLFALTIMVIVVVVLTAIPRINKTMIERARQDLKLMNTLVCIMAEALFVEDSQLVDQISESQIMAWVQVSKAKGANAVIFDTRGKVVYHPDYDEGESLLGLQDQRTKKYFIKDLLSMLPAPTLMSPWRGGWITGFRIKIPKAKPLPTRSCIIIFYVNATGWWPRRLTASR